MALPTPGPWTVRTVKRTTFVCDEHGNYIAAIKPVAKFGIAGDDAANAELIKQAGTVADETCMLPFALRDKFYERNQTIKDLAAALEAAKARLEYLGDADGIGLCGINHALAKVKA